MMDARVTMWEYRQGERECASAMKGRGRTRCRRQGGADRIVWLTGDGCVRGGQMRFCARAASDVPDGEWSRREQ